jgi:hypothetical protein
VLEGGIADDGSFRCGRHSVEQDTKIPPGKKDSVSARMEGRKRAGKTGGSPMFYSISDGMFSPGFRLIRILTGTWWVHGPHGMKKGTPRASTTRRKKRGDLVVIGRSVPPSLFNVTKPPAECPPNNELQFWKSGSGLMQPLKGQGSVDSVNGIVPGSAVSLRSEKAVGKPPSCRQQPGRIENEHGVRPCQPALFRARPCPSGYGDSEDQNSMAPFVGGSAAWPVASLSPVKCL